MIAPDDSLGVRGDGDGDDSSDQLWVMVVFTENATTGVGVMSLPTVLCLIA